MWESDGLKEDWEYGRRRTSVDSRRERESVQTRAPAEVGQEGASRRQLTDLLVAGDVHLGALRWVHQLHGCWNEERIESVIRRKEGAKSENVPDSDHIRVASRSIPGKA